MNLRALELDDMEPIRQWRNQCLDTLRTPFPLTKEQQEDWYRNEICNRQSRSRFWGIEENGSLIGYGGIENIQWENSIGEISLLINPKYRGQGYGKQAAIEIITQAFNRLNLHTVFGEVYMSNPACAFWQSIVGKYNGDTAILENRKYLDGVYHASLYFSVSQSMNSNMPDVTIPYDGFIGGAM
jgi:ribosomal protein S18 acetylase RimI-like enzyme